MQHTHNIVRTVHQHKFQKNPRLFSQLPIYKKIDSYVNKRHQLTQLWINIDDKRR